MEAEIAEIAIRLSATKNATGIGVIEVTGTLREKNGTTGEIEGTTGTGIGRGVMTVPAGSMETGLLEAKRDFDATKNLVDGLHGESGRMALLQHGGEDLVKGKALLIANIQQLLKDAHRFLNVDARHPVGT